MERYNRFRSAPRGDVAAITEIIWRAESRLTLFCVLLTWPSTVAKNKN